MGSTQQASGPENADGAETTSRTGGGVLESLRNSVLLKIATMGIVLLALGAILSEGVWAAIFAVWGIGLMLVGFGFYGLIWWRRNGLS